MIKQLMMFFVCKIKSHNLVEAGACPFTGKSYTVCLRCGVTLAK